MSNQHDDPTMPPAADVVDLDAARAEKQAAQQIADIKQTVKEQSLPPRLGMEDDAGMSPLDIAKRLVEDLSNDAIPCDGLVVLTYERPKVGVPKHGAPPPEAFEFFAGIMRAGLTDQEIVFLADYLRLQVMTRYSGVR